MENLSKFTLSFDLKASKTLNFIMNKLVFTPAVFALLNGVEAYKANEMTFSKAFQASSATTEQEGRRNHLKLHTR